jgi:hypothetical protein
MIIAAIALIQYGCKKNDESSSTSLTIRVIDNTGNSLPGASVKLYTSLEDLEQQEKQIGTTMTTDTTGEVKFDGLTELKYYWFAEKGCRNNMNGVYTTGKLDAGQSKTITSTLIETGTLELNNQSAGTYLVYVNGSLLLTADPLYSCTYKYVPAGPYTVIVSLVGGSTSKTYNQAITCGSTLTINYP